MKKDNKIGLLDLYKIKKTKMSYAKFKEYYSTLSKQEREYIVNVLKDVKEKNLKDDEAFNKKNMGVDLNDYVLETSTGKLKAIASAFVFFGGVIVTKALIDSNILQSSTGVIAPLTALGISTASVWLLFTGINDYIDDKTSKIYYSKHPTKHAKKGKLLERSWKLNRYDDVICEVDRAESFIEEEQPEK